ncbi:hypothetical protein DSO57_1021594 [Entomophthora muscae]|uniref:Uncharacterized protein n=1 Tax=Entomophthora muscae TaxID=34485 RepID=A0ACC2TES3_9FUNG|nr:hypothetical protein DSO57_1021594 [Entomophthora muscae]
MAGPANIQSATMNPSVASSDNILKADVYEIGWLFVQQYYTFLSSSPNKMYCFYASDSQLIHGSEGESTPTYVGQQNIRDHIKTFGYSDCKVLISNFDAQSCSNSSILLQVMGEIANKDNSAQRFVQTFCLCEIPTGFAVANDIFRFIADTVPLPSEKPVVEAKPVKQAATTQKSTAAKPSAPTVTKPTVAEVNSSKEESVNAASVPNPVTKEAEVEVTAPGSSISESKDASASSDPNNSLAAAPKSWANLVSKNSEKWGDKAASVSGVVVPAPATSSPQAEPKGPQKEGDSLTNHITVRCSKGPYNSKAIHEIFSMHGQIKHVDIHKNTYNVEFAHPDSAAKALVQSKFTHNGDTFTVEARRYGHASQGGRFSNSGNNSFHENRRGGGNNNPGQRRNNHGSNEHPSPDRNSFDKGGPGGNNRRGGSNGGRGGNRGNRQGHDGPSPK